MEDFFDSIIYIIIAIVGFAISALGKKKKKDARRVPPPKQQAPAQPKEKPFMSTLEQLLNEELGLSERKYENEFIEEIEEEKNEPVLDSPVSKIDNIENAIDSVPKEMLDDKEDVLYSIENEEVSDILKGAIKDLDEDKNKDSHKILEGFNLEDAIIYSEILNRKEY